MFITWTVQFMKELVYPNWQHYFENSGKVIQNIQDLKLGPDALILATYPRAGPNK